MNRIGTGAGQPMRMLREHEVMTLSVQDRAVFVTALLNAPAPATRLQKAVERYKKHQHCSVNTE